MPSLQDPLFEKSVIYVGEHDNHGAFGVVINKLTNLILEDVFEKLDIKGTCEQNTPVYVGGPSNHEHGFILHSNEKHHDGIAMSGSKDVLKGIACGRGPKRFIVTLGYTRWEQDELEEEISNVWLVAPADPRILNTPIHRRWVVAAGFAGVDICQISSAVGNA